MLIRLPHQGKTGKVLHQVHEIERNYFGHAQVACGGVTLVTSSSKSKLASVLSLDMKHPYSGWPTIILINYGRDELTDLTFAHSLKKCSGIRKTCRNVEIVIYQPQ